MNASYGRSPKEIWEDQIIELLETEAKLEPGRDQTEHLEALMLLNPTQVRLCLLRAERKLYRKQEMELWKARMIRSGKFFR